MAAITNAPLVTVDEYVARFIDGDEKPACEYVDGLLIPRPMGTKKRSQIQGNIARIIAKRYDDQFNPLPELTTHVSQDRFYISDMVIQDLSRPLSGKYPGPLQAVLLCIEILSPPDRIGKLFGKCADYHKWGVPYCWVIDPERKTAWEYFAEDVEPRKVAEVITAGPIRFSLDEVFDRV